MSFKIFQNEKTLFQAITTRSSKSLKNCHFSKGFNPWFWSKNGHFSNFIFQGIYARKMSFTIFQNEKTPFQAIKTRSSKSHKIGIFRKGLTHAFGPKWPFFQLYFLDNIGEENVFYDIVERKTPFQAIKTRSLKSHKIDIFPKGLTLGYWSNSGHFSNIFFWQF